jgi:hypothetical protein
VKKLLKMIVMSSTYKQSSHVTPKQLETDPDNTFLARGPRHRLTAEIIRDNALAASGLLVQKIGGESVKPYQPEGLWKEKNNFSHILIDYFPDKGDDLYRRSMYSFIRRTSPHPAMTAFDAPSRDYCVVKRESTNTPLQALILLNDPQFVEAARIMAERVQKEGGAKIEDQLEYAFRLATCRKPKPEELKLLAELYQKQFERFKNNRSLAEQFLSVGEYKQDKGLDKVTTAALAMVTNAMLNHDEFYMKR